MPSVREEAHLAMRELWEICDTELREKGTIPFPNSQPDFIEYLTPDGAHVQRSTNSYFCVEADFDKQTVEGSVEEVITVEFAEDMRDLADSRVEIEWYTEANSGVNTVPMKDFPKIAGLLKDMVRPEFVDASS